MAGTLRLAIVGLDRDQDGNLPVRLVLGELAVGDPARVDPLPERDFAGDLGELLLARDAGLAEEVGHFFFLDSAFARLLSSRLPFRLPCSLTSRTRS